MCGYFGLLGFYITKILSNIKDFIPVWVFFIIIISAISFLILASHKNVLLKNKQI